MGTILAFLATKTGGIASLVAASLLTVACAALGLSLWLTRSDLADERQRADTLESAVKIQNDAVVDLQQSAITAKAQADARALAVLAAKPKPINPATVKELNTWLSAP
jgi:hypothetical protein